MARLQFRHLEQAFNTREEAVNYIKRLTDTSDILHLELGQSLIGEPIVVKYSDENGKEQVILGIGTSGDKSDDPKIFADYHIIDSAFIDKSISELSGATEEILEEIQEILDEVQGLTERVDELESGLTETNERVQKLEDEVIKEIEVNTRFNEQLIVGLSGVTATVEDNKAYLEITTDNIPISKNAKDEEGHELDIIHHGHSLTELAINVDKAFKDEAEERKGIHLIKIQDGDYPATVSARYKLVDKAGVPVPNSAFIDIYKDSSLYRVYLGHVDDRIVSPSDPTVIDGSGSEALCFIYYNTEGHYELVAVDVETFLQESEFKDGLIVNSDTHEVRVKIDETSEPFLTVSMDGVKLSGVQNAIDTAFETENERAEAAEERLQDELNATQVGAGLNTDGSYVHDHYAHYVDEANSLANADHILDENLFNLSGVVISFSAATVGEIENIKESASSSYDELNTKIENEITRAVDSENNIAHHLAQEITRATNKESEIENNLAQEITRATNKESEIENDLAQEIERSTNKDNELESRLDAEIERSTNKDNELQEDVDNLNDRLTNITGQEGDTYKKHNTTPDDNANYIDVANSMDEADFILDQKLGELSAATVSEVARLDDAISAVASTTSSQINELSTALSNEITRATEVEGALQDAIDEEVSARESADNELDARLDALEAKTISGDKAIAVTVDGDDTKVSLLINEEDKVLTQNGAGLKTTLAVDILKENSKDYIVLKGTNGAEISRVDATDFIKDGMLDSVSWIGESNILQFVFNTDSGKEVINIDFSQFVNDEVNRQIAALSGAVATINGDINTPNSTYYKIDDVLVKYAVAGSAVEANGTLIRYYEDAEGHKYYVSNNAKDMVYSGTNLQNVITDILNDLTDVKEDIEEVKEDIEEVKDDVTDLTEKVIDIRERMVGFEEHLNEEIERSINEDNLLWSAITQEREEREAADEEIIEIINDNVLSAITELREYSDERDNEIERVTSTALNDLNERVIELETTPSIAYVSINDAKHYTVTGGSENYVDLGDGYLTSAQTITTREAFDNLTSTGSVVDAYVIKTVIDENEEAIDDLDDRVTDLENTPSIAYVSINGTKHYTVTGATENYVDLGNGFMTSAQTSAIVSGLVATADYVSSAKTIAFYNSDGGLIDTIDATAFIKDGMVDNVVVSGNSLIITFNTDSGKEDIVIPLTSIFDPSQYYSKTEIDNIVDDLETLIADNEFVVSSSLNDLNDRVIEISAITATKQDKLISGQNIKTINNESILGSGNITIQGGGGSFVKLTSAEWQAMYDAGTLDPDTLYIIVD